MTTRTAGPDYWFVDPAYAGIDRLAEDECPMDEIEYARDWDRLDREIAEDHSHHCLAALTVGTHHPDNCPVPGVK